MECGKRYETKREETLTCKNRKAPHQSAVDCRVRVVARERVSGGADLHLMQDGVGRRPDGHRGVHRSSRRCSLRLNMNSLEVTLLRVDVELADKRLLEYGH